MDVTLQSMGTRLFHTGSSSAWRAVMSTHRPSMLVVVVLFALAVPLSALTEPGFSAAAAACHPVLPGDNGQASQILSHTRPFAPRDRALFYTYELSDWKDAPPLEETQGPGLNEEET